MSTSATSTPWQSPAPLRSFKASGALRERMQLNFDRMDSARFAPVMKTGCLQGPDYAWPGDMEGRSLLAFVRLERATGRAAANLAGLRAAWPGQLNRHGYFGKPLDPNAINEQQLASHGWVLRGLCELYRWRKESQVLDGIRVMVRNLALPTRGAHAVYPIDPAERVKDRGSHVGEIAQTTGRWVLSSDVGCDLIFMDGLMHAAALLNDPEVDALCEEILARNLQIDLLAIQAQTHATLTGIRGMLRWAVHKQRPSLVTEAEKRFHLYVTEGISEDYQNWNWFGRPTHTEPCAVVDSFMVAQELWRLTGQAEYLAWAHRIAFNGFFSGQVANGGFGCSTVAGASGARHVGISGAAHEAWWCCSMRGAEGFAELAGRALYADGANLYVTGLCPGRIDMLLAGGRLIATATGGYPCEGRWILTVESAPEDPVTLHLFLPSWGSNPAVAINGQSVETRWSGGEWSGGLALRSFSEAGTPAPTSADRQQPVAAGFQPAVAGAGRVGPAFAGLRLGAHPPPQTSEDVGADFHASRRSVCAKPDARPSGCSAGWKPAATGDFVIVTLRLKSGDCLSYTFEQTIHVQPTLNRHSLPGHVTYNYGPLVLALPSGAPEVRSLPPAQAWRWNETAGCATAAGFDGALSPLGERRRRADPNPAAYGRQLLFEG